MTIGEKIKNKRIEKCLTQDDLAFACDVSRQTIYKWENNLSLPDTNSLPRLSKVLDMTYEELLGDSSTYDFDKKEYTNGGLEDIEKGAKKHWQKIFYFMPFGGLAMIFTSFMMKLFSKIFTNFSDSVNEGFNDPFFEDANASMNAMQISFMNIITIISNIILIIGFILLIAGILGIVYDRIKMKKYNG